MLKGLLSLFLQDSCPLCDRKAEQILCVDCQRQLNACQYQQPNRFWQRDLPLLSWGKYEGKLKQAITSLKYDNHPQLGVYLGQRLAQTWQTIPACRDLPSPLVIPIPLHPHRRQTRGFNQADLIAQGFCQGTGYQLRIDGIRRVIDTPALFSLSPLERQQSLHQAFTLGSLAKVRSQKLSVLLIDDIYTTGSTAQEVAKLLKTHQIPLLGIAAIATAQHK